MDAINQTLIQQEKELREKYAAEALVEAERKKLEHAENLKIEAQMAESYNKQVIETQKLMQT